MIINWIENMINWTDLLLSVSESCKFLEKILVRIRRKIVTILHVTRRVFETITMQGVHQHGTSHNDTTWYCSHGCVRNSHTNDNYYSGK